MNTSCEYQVFIQSQVGFQERSLMRGMSEYMDAEREAEKEARKEVSRTEAAPGSKSGVGVAKEQSTRRTR